MSRPDIIFFMVDQLSAKWLEAASSGVCPTPNLDRLRSLGVTFRNAITSNPVCCPTRATIATGLTTRGHGVLQNGYELDPALPTFMRSLQQAGWETGAFGKVHLRAHFHGVHLDYRPYGFGVVHNTEDPRAGEWLDWVEQEHPQHYDAALATIWPTGIPELREYGPSRADLRSRIEEVRRDFPWATPEFPHSNAGRHTLPFPEEVSQTAWITRHALDWIGNTERNRPLYAHISYVQPHGPFCPPAELMRCVNVDQIPAPVPAEWVEDPHAPAYFRDKTPVDAADWRITRQYYFADLVHLDRQLGLVLDALEQAGRLPNAYLIFLSDHGELFGDHGFRGKEERHYDACIRVPLIIAGPGLEQGLVCDQLVQLEDLCPTVLEMAAMPPPRFPKQGSYLKADAEDIPTLPGRSLLALCRGETPSGWREAAYTESYNAIWSVTPIDWARTIRTHDFRYTYYPHGGGDQLFCLRDDPDEQHNLVGDPAHEGVRQDLRDRLMELIIMQDYPLPMRELFALGVH